MDWSTCTADEERILSVHYTPGRQGQKINKILIHHNAGNLSIQGCYNTWQTREASAHYQVDANGRIGQLVYDRDTAWHAGDWNANLTSIGIEHADISTSPWRCSDATVESGAHLVAALCHLYGLGRPTWRVNVFPHQAFQATECPASLAGDQNAAYMARAQAWYDAMAGGTQPKPTPANTGGGSSDGPFDWWQFDPGDTLSSVAKRNGTTVGALLDLNPELKGRQNSIPVGYVVSLTRYGADHFGENPWGVADESGSAPASSPTDGFDWWEFDPGDTLTGVAAKNNKSVAELLDLNPELRGKENRIPVGYVISLTRWGADHFSQNPFGATEGTGL